MRNPAPTFEGKAAHVDRGRAACVLNPNANRLRDASFRAGVVSALRRRGVCIVETTPGALLRERICGPGDYETVIACGGDGTVWQTINAMDLPRQRLAVLPAGRGNSVAREFGVGSMEGALAALDDGVMTRRDAMEVAYRQDGTTRKTYALHAVAFGVLAEVVASADRLHALGALAYPISGLLGLPHARLYTAVCDGDAVELCHHSGVVILNTSWLAGYRPGRNVLSTDGLLDVFFEPGGLLAEKVSEISLVAGFVARGLETRQVVACRLRPHRPEALYLDGEVIPSVTEVDVRVVPELVRAIGAGGAG